MVCVVICGFSLGEIVCGCLVGFFGDWFGRGNFGNLFGDIMCLGIFGVCICFGGLLKKGFVNFCFEILFWCLIGILCG